MQNISIKCESYKISKTLKHSHNVIEVFKPFIRALERSWRKEKVEIIRPFLLWPCCLWHISHMLYLQRFQLKLLVFEIHQYEAMNRGHVV